MDNQILKETCLKYIDWIASYSAVCGSETGMLYGLEQQRRDFHDRIAEISGLDRYVIADIMYDFPIVTQENAARLADELYGNIQAHMQNSEQMQK